MIIGPGTHRWTTTRQRVLTFGAGTLAPARTIALTLTIAIGLFQAGPAQAAGRNTSSGSTKIGVPVAVTTAAVATPAVQIPSALAEYLHGDRTDTQWSLTATHTPAAWTASRGAGVVIATLDTGADATASDLSGQLLPGAHLDPVSGKIVAGSRPDLVGHGTHVAGIIVGSGDGHGVSGVAPAAKLLPVNLDTGDNLLTGSDVAAGLRWTVAHGARVVNLSLGFADVAVGAADVRAICQAVTEAVTAKVVVVASAGNDGQGSDSPEVPARCPGAISVAALNSDLHPAYWSSFDATVTIGAPGDAIYSTVTAGSSPLRYAVDSGTSMASPFVAGAAALVLAQHPDWTPAQVTARLVDTASDVPPPGRDPRTGAGVVDPPAAVGVTAPAPVAVAALKARADAYASRTDSSGRGVFDQVMLHWVPDPTVAVSGYRVTRWASAGPTTRTLPADAVRALFPAGPAGYMVTALTADGEVSTAPVWFPLPGQDMTPVWPVTGLHASWNRDGSVRLAWSNPRQNRGVADEWAVLMNDAVTLSGEKVSVPGSAVVPAGKVPAGDLVISVLVSSSASFDSQEARVALPARVPFAGVAVPAGQGRYRIDLMLAPSRRAVCGRSRCVGAAVTVYAGRYAHSTRIDSRGHVVVLVSSAARRRTLVVSVAAAGLPRLSDRTVTVPVS